MDGVPFSPDSGTLDGFSLGSSAHAALPGATINGTVQWPDLDEAFRSDTKTIFLELNSGREYPTQLNEKAKPLNMVKTS